ncbi:aminotransferase class IV [Polymorphobacter sp. PAMC 29334]|uniref:aminotransferase class IV n=1 Tax=Polymorphobacter sp. PAMC 29334 TaxID=2862331 RepID=UPI001C747AB6|nr:aminotransferase class IV [Polymorphobacter sp. PAMC 29334]QYE34185.1 aminotransferase class IV [Polymorphobacter sp. PAMC 29334]
MAGSQDFVDDPRNAGILAYVGGALVPASTASVSIFDAGFGLGDGVWEGLRLHRGALLFLDAHLDRLFASAGAIRIDIGLTRSELTAELVRLLTANRMTDGGHLRLMVTRGRKRTINQDPRHMAGGATIVVTAEFKVSPPRAAGDGLVLRTAATLTSGPDIFDMRLNSHSRLNLIRALLEVIDDGADEAVMLDPHGNVASCNATNLFWVKDGTVFTSGDVYCFNGITRQNVIAACAAGAAPLRQGDFPVDQLRNADEVFVTGTMGGITAVREIDGCAMPGTGAPVTARLLAAYEAMKDTDAAANRLV